MVAIAQNAVIWFHIRCVVAVKTNHFLSLFTAICADRVCQMTKTYNDIEAVTRLLEEVCWHLFELSTTQL